MVEIKRYTSAKADEWNRFVAASKNGTFLFDRRFMDYHSDRFSDHSLMCYRDGRLYALLPANEKGDTLVSHGGLTYGGLVTDSRCSAKGVLDTFTAINDYLRAAGFRHVVYKAIPWIYHQLPAEEDLYALTAVCRARLTIRDISSTIVASRRLKFTESRRSGLRKAQKAGLRFRESTNVDDFWPILNDNLMQRRINVTCDFFNFEMAGQMNFASLMPVLNEYGDSFVHFPRFEKNREGNIFLNGVFIWIKRKKCSMR